MNYPAHRAFVACAFAAVFLVACDRADEHKPAAESRTTERIVSLAPHITELVFAAGAGEYLVGVDKFSDFPPAVADVPRIGDAFRVDYEALSLLQPDLVLAWKSGTPVELIQRLRELGYRVVELESGSLYSIADQVQQLGELAGTSAVAKQAADRLRERIVKLGNQAGENERLSVFWQISADPHFTVTGRHVINNIIELCGGRNIFADVPGLAPAVTLEAILAARPDVIMASVSPTDETWKVPWLRWSELPAVRHERLYGVDRDLISRPGPRIIDGAVQVCAALEAARS